MRALHDAPSILERFTHGKEKYVAYIRSAFLEQVRQDDVVYHGLAGHFFLEGVTHVLKVRVLADLEDRVRCEVRREDCTAEEARRTLLRDDAERAKWSRHLYGIDTAAPGLYDLVVHVGPLTVRDAVGLISRTARLPQFQATPESTRVLDDLALAARVQAAIVGKWPQAQVTARDGEVVVGVKAPVGGEEALVRQVRELVGDQPELDDLKIRVRPTVFSVRGGELRVGEDPVLVVDDESSFARTLAKRLQLRGLDCVVAFDGGSALDALERGRFRGMLLDLRLPDLDGAEVLRRARARHHDLPVIIMTAHGTEEDRVECLQAGACAFLAKPVDLEEIVGRLSHLPEAGS